MEPKIRVKGFEDGWIPSRLGIIAPLTGGYAFQSSSFTKTGIPIVRISNILDSGVVGGEFAKYECFDNDQAFRLYNDDTVIAMSGATTGKVATVRTENYLYQNQRVGKFSKTNKVAYQFVSTFVSSEKFAKALNRLLTASAQPNASSKDIDSIELYMPQKYEEQQTIASYFRSIDSLIQSTSKKIESLKKVKAASMQSMFPQEGETAPRIRFKGFEGEWMTKPLYECLEISKERNTEDVFGINDVLSVSDEFGVRNQIELLGRSYAGKSVSNYGILRKGQLVYTKSPLKSKPYGIVKQNTYNTGIVSVLYAIYDAKECISTEYIHYYFDPSWRLNEYLRPLVRKGAKNTMNISDEEALSGFIQIPPTIEEQQLIADYFTNLDSQITLQSQRLEKLKQIKSACLDNMFV